MIRDTLPISVSIITLNEERNIGNCLMSVNFCREKIVVDSNSSDRTREIAKEMGAQVYVRPFEGHWQQKQWALERCTNEWVLCLDADERVTSTFKDFLYNLDLRKSLIDGYEIRRRHFFMGRKMGHSSLYPDYKLRLVRKERSRWGGVNPHDKLIVTGKTRKLPYEITHYAWLDFQDYLLTQIKYSRITAQEKFRSGKRARLYDLTFRPVYTFLYRYFIRLGILDGFPGFIISMGGAFACFAKYTFLKELENKNKENLLK
ncbi:MAG: glycosyltransferase family 2 protein [bacterium]